MNNSKVIVKCKPYNGLPLEALVIRRCLTAELFSKAYQPSIEAPVVQISEGKSSKLLLIVR